MENENKMVPEEVVNTTPETTASPAEAPAEPVAAAYEGGPKPAETRCINCQALLAEGQAFCPECGASQKKHCPKCGAEIKEGQGFCPACGENLNAVAATPTSSIDQFNQNVVNQAEKANKNKTIFAIIGAVALVLIVVIYFVSQYLKVETYKENAKAFCEKVLTSAVVLEDIGNEVKDEWYDYVYNRWSYHDSVDEAVDTALKNMSGEISTAKVQKVEIDALYSKLRKPVGNSEDIKELCDAVKVLYDEYEDMFDCVTDPSGNYNTFKSAFTTCDNETVEAYRDLKELCDDLK